MSDFEYLKSMYESHSLPEFLWLFATPRLICWYLYFLAGIGCLGGYAY